MSRFTRDNTTDDVLEGVDLTGTRALVTGTSSGLGQETARSLAAHGAAVTMATRSAEKNEAAAEAIRATVPDADLELRSLDLGSLDDIRSFAAGFLADHDRLDMLINNAGVMCCPLGRTEDGFEMQFGTNHLGHFLLTNLLVPALEAAAPSRVVSLSSGGHSISGILFDDPNFDTTDYDPWISYGQSKTANALFALELDRRLAPSGIHAYSVHPGMIQTELGRHMTRETVQAMQDRMKARQAVEGTAESGGDAMPMYKSVEQGAATQVWAATDPFLDDFGGRYLADVQLGEPGGPISSRGVAPHATDADAARRLWELSEELVGQSF